MLADATTPGALARSRAYVRLLRPANVVTALADVLAGYALAGAPGDASLAWLLLASGSLYAGGVVLNDAFDAELDARERPERPIPSGQAERTSAFALGGGLLLLGVAAAFGAAIAAGYVALVLAGLALLYDAAAKHSAVAGPYVIGACRALNLLLGLSVAAPAILAERAWITVLPLIYVAAIGLLARGEVQASQRTERQIALLLVLSVIAALATLTLRLPFGLPALALAVGLAFAVVPAFWHAARTGEPYRVRTAVKSALLGIVIFDAALATGYAGVEHGLTVLALLLVARPLAGRFAVT